MGDDTELAYVITYFDGEERQEDLVHCDKVAMIDNLVVFLKGNVPMLMIGASFIIKVELLDDTFLSQLL